MRAQPRGMGNSSGVIIPKPVLAQLGVAAGDGLDLSIEARCLILAPVPAHPRAGWRRRRGRSPRPATTSLCGPSSAEGDTDLQW